MVSLTCRVFGTESHCICSSRDRWIRAMAKEFYKKNAMTLTTEKLCLKKNTTSLALVQINLGGSLDVFRCEFSFGLL